MSTQTFTDLGLVAPLTRALSEENYTQPTPIQLKAIPPLLAGKDLLGIAQTGTGKTAAFGLPLLQKLAGDPNRAIACGTRALILAPTRELAIQIDESLKTYGRHLKLRHAVIYGGVNANKQIATLSRGVDLLVATPGRLIDLVGQKRLRLDTVSTFIVDEADRMLDMGFIRDVRRIVAMLPKQRQSMLFSATMPDDIVRLVGDMLKSPERIEVAPQSKPAERVEQHVVFTPMKEKRQLLAHLLRNPDCTRVIVFTRTKHGANRVAETLGKAGFEAEAIHGNKSQNARQRALARFRAGDATILVATDIAARGIDIDEVSHVVNFELPNEPESYVHRIGRTARAGASGIAISLVDTEERGLLRQIERITRQQLKAMEPEGFEYVVPAGGDRGGEDRRGPRPGPRQARKPNGKPGSKPGKPQFGKPHSGKPQRGKPAAKSGAGADSRRPNNHRGRPTARPAARG